MRSEAILRRNRRLGAAVGTSLLSKALGAVLQIISLPIIQQALGTERLAAYLALTALVAWIAPLGLGVLPAMTRQLAVAAAGSDHRREARLVGAGFWFTLCVGSGIAALSIVGVEFLGAARLVGNVPGVAQQELDGALLAALLLTSAYFFGNCAAAMRAGYQQMHISNMLSTIANLLSLAMLALLWKREALIAWFVVAVYAPLTALMLVDLARQFHERRYLFPPPTPAFRDLREGELSGLLQTSGVAWIAQLHGFLVAHASVLMVSHAAGADETAAFGTLMRGALLVYAVVGLYVWPMVPALSDAIARKEWVWARRSWLRSVWVTLAIAVPSALALGVMGPWIVRVWLGAEVPVPPLMAAGMGLFLLGFNLNFLGFNTCLALGATRWLAWTYLAEAALFVLLSILLAPQLGATGIALALGLSSVAINFWIMPLRSLQRLRGLP